MGKLRNVCSILVRKFRGRDHVGVLSIDVMLNLPKYAMFFLLISQLKTGGGGGLL